MDQAKAKLERAIWLHQEGKDLNISEKLYIEVLESRSDNNAAVNLGSLLRSQGRLKEGVTHYKKWITKLPHNKLLRQNGINCAIEATYFYEAELWAREGMEGEDENKDFEFSIARIYNANKKYKEAESVISRILKNEKLLLSF